MLFNSIEFILFFILFIWLYYSLPKKFQIAGVLLGSIVFVMYHVPVFILPVFFLIIANYFFGRALESIRESRKKIILVSGLIIDIGILFFYKYFNFFNENLSAFLELFGAKNPLPYSNLLLPLGISFYSFQAISYLIDIYWGKYVSEKQFLNFSVYLLFFPKFISGPVERSYNFLPQLYNNITFERKNLVAGLRLILWGLFKKLVIADRIELITSRVFENPADYHGFPVILAIYLYLVQIYLDFSGYTDMAIGTSKMMGIDLMENFRRPLFAKSISDFWRRWHISLSTWVNEYIYTPIAMNNRKWGNTGVVFALIITFVILGFWHGDAWNFIIYGLVHGIAVSYEALTKKIRKKIRTHFNESVYNVASIFITISFVSFSVVFFRAHSTSDALLIFQNAFNQFDLSIANLHLGVSYKDIIIICTGFILIEYGEFLKELYQGFDDLFSKIVVWKRYSIYYLLLMSIVLFGIFGASGFIYFKF